MDDGAIVLTVVDPAGVILGGDFSGVHVPFGSMFPYGFYWIHPDPPANGGPAQSGPQWEPVLIHFRGFEPLIPGPTGAATFRCQLISEEFGTGFAQGIFASRPLPDGNVRIVARNVMTMRKD